MVARGPHHSNITWNPHLRLSWGGTLGTGKEIWTNSVRFWYLDEAFIPSEAQLAAMDAGFNSYIGGWVSNSNNSYIGQDAKLTWIKCNPIGADGLQVTQQTHRYDVPAGGTSGLNLNSVPFYQTYAITLRTALKRGRAHSGRIFPPCVQPPVQPGTGQCSAGAATNMATAFAGTLKALTTTITTASQVGSFAVLSPGNTLKGTVPRAMIITSCVVDATPDVQHRRTNKIPRLEGAASAAV